MKYSLVDTVKFSVCINHTEWIKEQIKRHAQGSNDPISKSCSSNFHNKKFKVEGPYGPSATIWSKKNGTLLMIECSAPKFLNGHNLFGDDNLSSLIYEVTKYICKHLSLKITSSEKKAINTGNVRIYRFDLATHIKLPDDISASDFIQALKLQLAFTQRSFSTYFNESIYIDQGSDMKSLKIYDKYKEILAHKFPENLPDKDSLFNYANNLLRIEMTFRNRFLKNNSYNLAQKIKTKSMHKYMKEMILSLNLTDSSLLQAKINKNIGTIQNLLLLLHSSGIEISSTMSDRQLKKHAKHIMKKTGININSPYVKNPLSQIAVKKYMENLKF